MTYVFIGTGIPQECPTCGHVAEPLVFELHPQPEQQITERPPIMARCAVMVCQTTWPMQEPEGP